MTSSGSWASRCWAMVTLPGRAGGVALLSASAGRASSRQLAARSRRRARTASCELRAASLRRPGGGARAGHGSERRVRLAAEDRPVVAELRVQKQVRRRAEDDEDDRGPQKRADIDVALLVMGLRIHDLRH